MEDILAFIPGLKFPDVSITGSICPLGCKYCKGYYLRNMEPTLTPKKLYDCLLYTSPSPRDRG